MPKGTDVSPSQPRARAVTRLLLAALALTLFGTGATVAWAHSDEFDSVPAAGSTSSQVTEIQFIFSEPVQRNLNPEAVLANSDGISVELGAPTFSVTGETMTLPILSGALPDGNYKADYRIVSADGHPASGTLLFTVQGSSAPALVAAPASTDAPLVISPNPTSAPVDVDDTLGLGLAIGGVVVVLALLLVVWLIRRNRA
jgi:methionine-rich copper-binding protein CopC